MFVESNKLKLIKGTRNTQIHLHVFYVNAVMIIFIGALSNLEA